VARVQGRQDALPSKRAVKKAPRRSLAMLLVIDRGEVLLEKRPARGIWGGLWSLPEAPDSRAVADVARREWGLSPSRLERLAPFEHAFTHFTLEVAPWRVHARRGPRTPPNALWLPLSEIEGAALPSPVRKLLRRSASAASGSGAGPRGASKRR
jgi:A/G-specific adenine glycosylase